MPLKEIPIAEKRCFNCNSILFVGNIQRGMIDIDCKKCKTKNVFVVGDILAEGQSSTDQLIRKVLPRASDLKAYGFNDHQIKHLSRFMTITP
jgi:phage FluMu protein Com